MRLPSVDRLARSASATARRFPAVIAAAVLITVAAQLAVDDPGDDLLGRVLYAATLALPLFFAVAALAEVRGWRGGRTAAARLAAGAVLAAIFLLQPGWTDAVAARRYLQLSAGFHLMVAFLPFLGTDSTRGFWQYNKSLFLRFLAATLYAAVLCAGLAVALLAVDNLFGVEVPGEAYTRMAIAIAFLFHPWFFLAGVPDDLEALDRRGDYPKGLKIFTQYVLVPLVVVYLAILTAYAVTVLATWEWPSGWIGWLVSSVAVVGILATLLVHPVRDRAENAWVRVYGRWFWPALLPAVVLLLLAARQRIGQYGFTEDRYFLLLLGLWLAGTTVYYAVTRSDDVRLVPQTLCAVLLLTVGGPWSAYAVSERSQVERLAGLLRENGLLAEGRVRPASDSVPFEDRREISAVLRYLNSVHGTERVEPWFEGDGTGSGREEEDGRPLVLTAPEAVDRLGLEYVPRWETSEPDADDPFRLAARRGPAVGSVAGYAWMVRNVSLGAVDTVDADGRRLVVRGDSAELHVQSDGRTLLRFPVAEHVRKVPKADRGRTVPPGELWLPVEGDSLRGALWVTSAAGNVTGGGGVRLRQWYGDLFLGPPADRDAE